MWFKMVWFKSWEKAEGTGIGLESQKSAADMIQTQPSSLSDTHKDGCLQCAKQYYAIVL